MTVSTAKSISTIEANELLVTVFVLRNSDARKTGEKCYTSLDAATEVQDRENDAFQVEYDALKAKGKRATLNQWEMTAEQALLVEGVYYLQQKVVISTGDIKQDFLQKMASMEGLSVAEKRMLAEMLANG